MIRLLLLYLTFNLVFGASLASNSVRYNIEEELSENFIADYDTQLGKDLVFYYQQNCFKPIWRSQQLQLELEKILAIYPSLNYHNDDELISKLYVLSNKSFPLERAKKDILYSMVFLKSLNYFLNGKVFDKMPNKFHHEKEIFNSFQNLSSVSILQSIDTLHNLLSNPQLKGLINQAIYYYMIQKEVSWGVSILKTDTLFVGMKDSIIPQIRAKLYWLNDLKTTHRAKSLLFDNELKDAVKQFQSRNKLLDSGFIDQKTIDALNYEPKEIYQRIVVNIERWLWMPSDLGEYYIQADIPSFKMKLIQGDSVINTQKIVVGKSSRATPVFSSKMQYAEINPTWTVPPTILTNDIVPRASRSPAYLQGKNIDVFSKASSTYVPYGEINWSSYNSYRFVQQPGTNNALGKVKFIFPNPYYIFLHDTPAKNYFESDYRAESSGCVRIEDPEGFTHLMLRYNFEVSTDSINKIYLGEKTTRVILANPANVHITYFTTEIENNRLIFHNDVYKYDDSLFKEL